MSKRDYERRCAKLIEDLAIEGEAFGEDEQAEAYRNFLKEIQSLYETMPRPSPWARLKVRLRQWRCRHVFDRYYGGLRADEPGGAKIYHEIFWKCARCGKKVGEWTAKIT